MIRPPTGVGEDVTNFRGLQGGDGSYPPGSDMPESPLELAAPRAECCSGNGSNVERMLPKTDTDAMTQQRVDEPNNSGP